MEPPRHPSMMIYLHSIIPFCSVDGMKLPPLPPLLGQKSSFTNSLCGGGGYIVATIRDGTSRRPAGPWSPPTLLKNKN
jgi:hypothetical protein